MSAVLIRIALRYLAGVLIGHGLLSADMNDLFSDPDLVSIIETGAGLFIGVASEGFYILAKRFGWAT